MLTWKQYEGKILFTRKQKKKKNCKKNIEKELLKKIISFYENIDILDKEYKSASGKILVDYKFNEMHCIDFIGKLDKPNVTKLSDNLNLTRGAVSKIIKKLVKKGAIEIYRTENNKKEIYYKLTESGRKIFLAHEKMHHEWEKEDMEYLSGIDKDELVRVCAFFDNYNKFLESRIKIMKGEKNEYSAD